MGEVQCFKGLMSLMMQGSNESNDTNFGGIKPYKCMIILRDFPYNSA